MTVPPPTVAPPRDASAFHGGQDRAPGQPRGLSAPRHVPIPEMRCISVASRPPRPDRPVGVGLPAKD